MNFGGLRNPDHVKYSRILSKKLHEFADGAVFEKDSFNCLFYVEKTTDDEIQLSCVEACGRHNLEAFTKEEYQEYSAILGEPLLRISSVNEHLASGPAVDMSDGIRSFSQVMRDTPDGRRVMVDEYECFNVDDDVEDVLLLLKSQVQKKHM